MQWVRWLALSASLTTAVAGLPAARAAADGDGADGGAPDAAADFATRPAVRDFIGQMVARHGFDADALERLFATARFRPEIIERISRPAERTLSWAQYRRIFLTDDRIEQGVTFWNAHAGTLARAQARYGVPAEYVVAILGVETRYGRHAGSFRVLDALSTLAFDYPPRGTFFRSELEQYLLLTREEQLDPVRQTGSYAGAMGYGQFIASSYRAYAVDFDDDGVRDILSDVDDAIGSVANYFAAHGWLAGGEVARRVQVRDAAAASPLANTGLEPRVDVARLRAAGITGLDGLAAQAPVTLWRLDGPDGVEWVAGLDDFRVITRYNHSELYALAVHDLAEAIRAAHGAAAGQGDDA